MKIGDIVVCINEEHNIVFGKKGVIVEVSQEKDLIKVLFPWWEKDIAMHRCDFDAERNKQGQVVEFKESDLRVCGDFLIMPDLETMAKTLLDIPCWEFRKPRMPLIVGQTNCMHEDCNKKAWFLIIINFVGSAYVVYVCPEHAGANGIKTEEFPYKYKP